MKNGTISEGPIFYSEYVQQIIFFWSHAVVQGKNNLFRYQMSDYILVFIMAFMGRDVNFKCLL